MDAQRPGDDRPLFNFKILLCGEEQVGKTQLIDSLVSACFLYESAEPRAGTEATEMKPLGREGFEPTFGVDRKMVSMEVDGNRVDLQLWDTGIFQSYRDVTPNIYRRLNVLLIIFDITRLKTWIEVEEWRKAVEVYKPESCRLVIIENKIDLEAQREVPSEEIAEYCKSKNLDCFRTNASDISSVLELFSQLSSKLIKEEHKRKSNRSSTRSELEGIVCAEPDLFVNTTSPTSAAGCCG